MKRALSFLLSAALLLALLPACQGPAAESPAPADIELPCHKFLTAVWKAADIELSSPEFIGRVDIDDREQLAAYIQGAYGLSEGEWTDGYIARQAGASAVELAMLRFADESAAQHGEDCLKDYLHAREGDFTGYAPEQAQLVANGVVCRQGTYVALFIHENAEAARSAFLAAMETGELPTPAPTPEPLPTPEPITDVGEILNKLLELCAYYDEDAVSGAERVDGSDPDRLKSIIEDVYGLAGFGWEEAAIARGTDGSVFEIAVLRAAEGQDPWEIVNALTQGYLDVKEDGYTGPADQAELLSEAVAGNPNNSDIVVLAVCSKPSSTIFSACQLLGVSGYSSSQRHWSAPEPTPNPDPDPNYPDRVRFVDPGKEDMSLYDTSAILAAWEKDDPSSLSAYDRDIYEGAQRVFAEAITSGMTPLEQENALFDWVANNVNYDHSLQDVMMETSRDSYGPYGGLVNREAVCLGYATTFQLLMDLAGIECITVRGACFNSEEHHAWNMVRLNGNWYCVDVTWDANGREQLGDQYTAWRYFNITSDEMAKGHQWDYLNVPEATATDGGQG